MSEKKYKKLAEEIITEIAKCGLFHVECNKCKSDSDYIVIWKDNAIEHIAYMIRKKPPKQGGQR